MAAVGVISTGHAQMYNDQEWPALDHGHRHQSEPLNIDELCRKLEAHRLHLRMTQLRERSLKRRESATQNPTYKPRYSMFGEAKGIPMKKPSFDSEKIDSAMSNSREDEWPEWVNPKALLAARSQGMSEAEARKHVTERERADQERSKERKSMNRASIVFGKAKKTVDESPTKKRPLSTVFQRSSATNIFLSWQGSGIRAISPSLSGTDEESKEESNLKRMSHVPSTEARTNWAQPDAIGNSPASTEQTSGMPYRFRRQLANLPPLVVAASSPKVSSDESKLNTAVSPMTQPPAVIRPPASTRPSADSAICMGSDKDTVPSGGEKGERRLRLKKSLREIFRRRTE